MAESRLLQQMRKFEVINNALQSGLARAEQYSKPFERALVIESELRGFGLRITFVPKKKIDPRQTKMEVANV
jgi:hypothetical protein